MDDIRPSIAAGSTKFLDCIRKDMRDKGYAYQTEKTYVDWIRRFILFHGKQHPAKMGGGHINQHLSHLGHDRHCSPATQRIALNALAYLYRKFLQVELLYGSGIRLNELLSLRVKDLDFEMLTITVRSGKGDKDRTTLLPQSLAEKLQLQVRSVANLHQRDTADGFGEVYMPHALERKYPSAARELGWQYLFPATSIGRDPRSGTRRRHHLHHTTLRKTVSLARKQAGIVKPVRCHTFRHSFATRLLQQGYDLRTIQKLLGHSDVKTTEIYTHVLGRGAMGVVSPVDGLR